MIPRPDFARLLAIDPGKHQSGWALFQDERLHSCGFDAPFVSAFVTWIAVEIPVVRRVGKSKGDPGDLIQLAFAAGVWAGLHRDAHVTQYGPEYWKGQTPKRVVHRRALATLYAPERDLVPPLPKSDRANDVNTWDAIAIGLFHLGRLR